MIVFDPRQRQTFVHRIDPRVRVVVAFAFAVVVCLSERPTVLGAALAAAAIALALTRTRLADISRRLIELNVFMALLAILLPLTTPGETVFQLGWFAWSREGLVQAGTIAWRANTIVLAMTALLATMEPARLGFALSQLGVPDKLVHVMLFMVRYIEVIHQEYHRLRDAMRLRAFRPACNRHTLRSVGYLVGQLLARSLDRSERVVEAMKCRGFRGQFHVLATFRVKPSDAGFALVATVGMALMVWMETR